ncbi:MAG: 50S ribosomal protein L13 [Candidatus Schekmanbacteria bacterium RBG_16_38_10]|uniref:Large ribosomal subunit protein uL13 n=1 Tax=Candidatus Schekmanbacteria bacterium RBG_16_38_10 TaxID=1817879 RepID=A0A1F7RYX6_9BACT|nr:MAG: 50S ribosomal protein L13 [Candidatus Schekmanbacteria bacterium RBG_16_38_10]
MKLSSKSFCAKKEDMQRSWYLVDADGKILGRLASKIAMILMGKNKPIYTAHVDTGDHVVVINAEKILLTGDKLNKKIYYSHSNYPGGLKEINAKKLLEKKPEMVLEKAVQRMLPKNKLGRAMAKKLKVYSGTTHPHQSQNPQNLNL